jgi:hypothetical protein
MGASAQEIVPFPPTPSGSTTGLTIQDSTDGKRVEPKRLAPGGPNILVIGLGRVPAAMSLHFTSNATFIGAIGKTQIVHLKK